MRARRYLLILLLVLLPAGPFATTFPVTKTEDTNDGACDLDCSLREAIAAANANPGADDVPVPAGNYLLTLGQLVVSDDVSIAGAGQANTIIDGNDEERVLDIEATSGVVSISGVSIQYGSANRGGGIRNASTLNLTDSTVWYNYAHIARVPGGVLSSAGAGISNLEGKLTLTNSTVSHNSADGGYYDASGGGIANFRGEMMLINSTVQGNRTYGEYYVTLGGGIANLGGRVTLVHSIVRNNSAASDYFGGGGGGLWNRAGHMTLINSSVRRNSADFGGGIAGSDRFGGSAYVTLINSTVAANSADYGGGIRNSRGNMTLIDSAVLNNFAFSGGGGGISGDNLTITNSTVSGNYLLGNLSRSAAGVAAYNSTITNSTVSGNTSYGVGVGGVHGIDHSVFENLAISNTIVADNLGGNCAGILDSLGYNLVDDDSCDFTEPGDSVVVDAMLGPLADNGGPTRTHELLAGSPAIDAGGFDCPPPATDQRGVARPQGAACDIGAFEFGATPASDANALLRFANTVCDTDSLTYCDTRDFRRNRYSTG